MAVAPRDDLLRQAGAEPGTNTFADLKDDDYFIVFITEGDAQTACTGVLRKLNDGQAEIAFFRQVEPGYIVSKQAGTTLELPADTPVIKLRLGRYFGE